MKTQTTETDMSIERALGLIILVILVVFVANRML